MRHTLVFTFSALLLGSFAACGDDDNNDATHGDGDHDHGDGACESSSVSYADVSAFSQKYCAACHSNTEVPTCTGECKDHPLATEADWKRLGVHALAAVESGSMPQAGQKPSQSDIDMLSEWVKCNADAHDHEH